MAKRAKFWGFICGAIIAVSIGWWGFARAGSDFSPEPGMPNGIWNPLAHRHQSAIYLLKQNAQREKVSTRLEALHCLFSAVGLLRFYDLFQPLEAPWQLIVAQFLVPGVALFGASAVFIVGVQKNLRTALARHKTGHTVVCGIGDVGMQVVQNLNAAGEEVVAVDLHGNSPHAATCEKSGVLLVQGDAKNREVLVAAGVHHAQKAILSTGSDSENMDIALQIQSMYAGNAKLKPGKIQVLAELRSDWMHKRLLGADMSLMGAAGVDLRLFNPFTDAARMLIKRLHLQPSPEFTAQTFVLIGFGAYCREIALHLIRSSPVALNKPGASQDRKLKILVFDEKADEARERFALTNPAALEWASLEFVSAAVAEGSPDLVRTVLPRLKEAGPLLGAAVALGDDQVSLSGALEVRTLLDHLGDFSVPIYVRLEHYRRLGELVRSVESVSSFSDRVQIFGTLEETLSPGVLLDSKLDVFAQALQAEYRSRPKEVKNPKADKDWPELSEFYKMSNRWRADHTPLLMELAGMHVAHVVSPAIATLSDNTIDLLAQLEHRRYRIERRMNENRPRAEWADDPNLREWEKLDPAGQQYNRDEVKKLPAIMAGLGIELRPVRAVHIYGDRLAEAANEIDRLAADSQTAHFNLFVDLDLDDAIRLAGRALGLNLPSLSLWLVSKNVPEEFSIRKPPKGAPAERPAVIQRASGWAPKDRLQAE